MTPLVPLTRDLVLVGGGHSHALVLRMWGMKPLAGVRLTVINPGPTAPYSGMLPGHIAGHYTRDELDIDLVKLCRFAGARLVIGEATHIDPQAKTVTVKGRPPIGYDVASIDIGIHTQMPEMAGFAEFGVAVKPLSVFASRWAKHLDSSRTNRIPADLAVIGGGIGGAEIAMAMSHAVRQTGQAPNVSLIEASSRLAGVGKRSERLVLNGLQKCGVKVLFESTVSEVTSDCVLLSDGSEIPSQFTVGSTGGRPHSWVLQTSLPLHNGFIEVDETLSVIGQPDIFAAGDCAHLSHAPRPKAGVYAVRAGSVLLHNLKARFSGGALKAYRPQRTYLKLISLGEQRAVADKGGVSLSGKRLWNWKNRIDQKFMEKFRELPKMATAPLPDHALGVADALGENPLCGGCGAKVGPGVLGEALTAVPVSVRNDVLSQPGDDAALLGFGDKSQVISVDHLRSFDEDVWRMARIATVHALGDIWAMGAEPQSVLASLTLTRMEPELQKRTLAEIMDGIRSIAEPAGAEIVGGHTTLGAETTIGLTVTGVLKADQRPITLEGARAGDALILTRPIGSGTLLAAEMTGDAKGADVVALLDEMQKPQSTAAAILKDAHAMTDVTGFGLGGHLLAMCQASGVGAALKLDAIPVFDGARDLCEAGTRSSIYPENAKAKASFEGLTGPVGDLLFDPQTSGGLLASVAADTAENLIGSLREAGYPAAIIGTITDQSTRIVCE